jgi:very-short-patch-repair endonuclease
MAISTDIIDIIHSLLKGAPAGMETSEILRGLRNRGISVSYLELEDWLHDQETVGRADNGGFRLSYDVSMNNLPRRRILPEMGESDLDMDGSQALPRLIDYYINCLREEGKRVYTYRTHQGSSFITLDQELISDGRPFVSVTRTDQPDFLKTIANRSVFYGYPLYLEWIESRDNDFCDYRVTPVFIIRMEMEETPQSAIFKAATAHVRLNPEMMAKLKWRDRAHFEKILDAPDEQYSSFAERVALAATELADLGIAEELDPSRIYRARDLKMLEEKKPGIYNLCGLFSTGADPYNKRLLSELEQVRNIPAEQVSTTSLAALLRSKQQNAVKRTELRLSKGHCIFPGIGESLLNADQIAAVKESFTFPVSVVTGPPGSGKSEVVASLVVNAVLNGMSVLFASRNNKAVEVVQERLKELAGPDGLLRVGGNHDQDVLERLDKLDALPPGSAGSFSALWQACLNLVDEVEICNRKVRQWAELLDRSTAANLDFESMKRQHMRGIADGEEKLSRVNLDAFAEATRLLSTIYNDHRRGAKLAAWLKYKLGTKRGLEALSNLKAELEKAELDVSCVWPAKTKDIEPLLMRLMEIVDLLDVHNRLIAVNDAIAQEVPLDEVLQQVAEARSRLAEQVPRLIALKVKDNSAGPVDADDSNDALSRFRENFRRLIRSKMDAEQRAVREAIQAQSFSEVLKRLPAWSVTNLSVGGRIPLQPGIFDLVIIDEASQCDIASCVPLLARSKRVVVIGDPLQLSQISNVSAAAEQQFLTEHALNHPAFDHLIYTQKSIYDAARHVVPGRAYTFLENHYRCRGDIIQFANTDHWYGKETLKVFTNEASLKRPDWWEKGIIWEQVQSGGFGDGRKYILNEEVERAVAVVKELEKRNYEGTVGVVCPFRDMTDRIRDAVPGGVSAHFLRGTNFEAQTAHGFQGDARDIIIFVMGIHPDMPKGKRWFISDANKNLFNVALSRAKAAFVVVGDRDVAAKLQHDNKPIQYLRDFVAYVDELEMPATEPTDENADPVFEPKQIWEEKFYFGALKPAGLPVISQHPVGPYKLDFALLHNGKKLDIEVDGEQWHKDAAGNRLEKDIDRNIYVKSQGWDVMRFWVYELKEDMEKCLKKIQDWMN